MYSFITSGTYEFLVKIKKKHPSEELVLMENENSSFLYHETKDATIFKEPRRYEVIDSIGTVGNGRFVVFNNIPVTDEGRPLFEYQSKNRMGLIEKEPGFVAIRILRPLSSDTYVIMTVWETEKDFKKWQQSASFANAHSKSGKEKESILQKKTIYPRPSYVTKYTIPKEED